MSIRFNPTLFSADPAGGKDHIRRLMLNPPEEFVESAAAQNAIAAGRNPAPFSDGPITFGADGQAIMSRPPQGQAQGSWSQPADTSDWQNPGSPGSGVHYASGMGMGVESHDQQGLDNGWMQQIQGQIAAGQPAQAPMNGDQTVGIMTAPNDPASTDAYTAATAAATGTTPVDSIDSATATATASIAAITSAITATVSAATSLSPSIRTSTAMSVSASISSASASASATSEPQAPHKPFVKSTAFILIIVLCCLILVGVIATALRWAFRWKSKDGNDRYLGGMLHRRRRDVEADDLSDIVRHFGGGTIEKRSSLLAEEMGHAPYLHSDDQLRPVNLGVTDEPMEDIDLDAPRAPALHEQHGSPSMPCSTQRLEIRNTDPDDYERAKTLPKSWVADRALANIANWPKASSVRSDSLASDSSLPSPFSAKAVSAAGEEEWPRSASQCSSRVSTVADGPPPSASWASTLRHSLFTAIGGKAEEDKYTRPVLPVHSRSLSRASTARTARSSLSAAGLRESQTFGRATGRGLVIEEEDDNYSISSSARDEMRQALLFDGRSVGERYKAYARSLRSNASESMM